MNSCILIAQIVSDPELRSTQDNRDVAYMMAEFAGLRADDPPARIRVVGWGNLASEIKNSYAVGDRVIIEGRLSMHLIDMPEGYKEKRAELVASRIYPMMSDGAAAYTRNTSASTTQTESFVVSSPVSSSSNWTEPESITAQTKQTAKGLSPGDTPSVYTPNQASESSSSKVSLSSPLTTETDSESANAPSSDNSDWDDIPF